MKNIIKQITNWPKGIRFYVGLTTILFTLEAYLWTKSVYGSATTATIRLQEIYAWTALSLILLTLAVGPLCSLVPRLPGKSILRDARRLLGISAAWFAAWHVGVSYLNQFDKVNPLKLPAIYQTGFSIGLVAMIILIAMTITSFDAAFRRLGSWWFRLHRLIYAAVLLILLHAFMIGVHATTAPFIISLSIAIAVLFAAQFYLGFGPGREPTILRSIILCYGLLFTIAVFGYGFVQQSNARRTTDTNSGGSQYGLR